MSLFPLNLIPANTRFDFMRLRATWLALATLTLFGALSIIAFKGFNYALDFTGGTAVNIRFEKMMDVDDVRARLESAGIIGAQVQTFGSGSDLLIRVRSMDEATEAVARGGIDSDSGMAQKVLQAVSSAEAPGQIMSTAEIGAQVSGELRQNALNATLFVLIGFLIYISFRFELKFAIVASATTLFDVIVVAGLFALTGREFDLTVLAGLLSVMGFSINDTIVVFDRVRENFRSLRVGPLQVFNLSINQTLSRTIITSVVFFLSVLALFLYGGGSLEGLALTQMLGAIVGTLSSIFIACPMLTYGWLKVTKQDLLPKAKDVEELARRP